MKAAPKSTSPIRPLFQAQSLDVTQLNSKADSALPPGFKVERIHPEGYADQVFEWNGTAWEDALTLTEVTSTGLSGVIRFPNPSSTDIDFTW